MHRIDHSTATVDNLFTEGNPSTGTPATTVTDDWLNDVQENLSNFIEDQGITLVKGDGNQLKEAVQASYEGLIPIGTIIPFYDYNGALTFDSSIWKYCDGSTVTISGIGSQTLPDLSNRYLVGFGTEGGGDIDTATWATSAVGNASHQANLQHSHTVSAHTHDVNVAATISSSDGAHTHTVASHTHTVPSHYHGKGTLNITSSGSHTHQLYVYDPGVANGTQTYISADGHSGYGWINTASVASTLSSHTHDNTYFAGSVGNTAGSDGDAAMTSGASSPATDSQGAHTHTVDPVNTTSTSASPTTDSQLSTTQSIQPRSIRVRFLMRVA